ncbi:MAG TPA: hypothetical protein VMW62_17295 [Chloroflexota bacterium]|nr:hypothetical protein [Chloroflexota bacterium]
MLLLISGLAAVALLLLALRLTQRLTLRFKLLAGVSVSRQPQKSCPHLGLSADPFTHQHLPSDDHRCYLWMQRDRIDLVHQKGFCLTTAHHKCPWLMVRHPNATPPLRRRLPVLVAAFPKTAWAAIRAVPRPALSPSAQDWERPGEGAHRFRQRAAAVLASLRRAAEGSARAGAPRLAAAASRLGATLLLAALWTSRMLWRLCLLLARALRWLLPRLARALMARVRALAHAISAHRRATLTATAPKPAAAMPAVAEVHESEPVLEPVAAPPSLARIEELLAEGLATLDRGQESLAYHIFAKVTEQREPRGAGDAYHDVIKRAWFWRAKTAETIGDVVESLEQALFYEPGNLQMQAHLAWARQRLERERKLVPIEQATPPPAPAPLPEPAARWQGSLGVGVRMAGGLMALALAALWMTTAVMPALGRLLSQLPAGDELLLRRLILTLNATALPGQGHLPLPVVNYDLGLALPFVMAFSFVFTARGLMDGDTWARTTGLFLAGIGGWLCAAAVSNPDASRLGLALCVGIIVAVVAGRFDSPKALPQEWVGY